MSELPTEKFWMVHGIGKGAPTARHDTFGSAQIEARRLAQCYPGTPFVVLVAVEVIQKREFDVIRLRDPSTGEEIPF